jgi:hypothetical protein
VELLLLLLDLLLRLRHDSLEAGHVAREVRVPRRSEH